MSMASRWTGGRRFSAMLLPGGVVVVEYRQSGDELETLQLAADRTHLEGLDEAADLLGNTVESLGGRGGRLALALGGFGASHHILELPPAEEELLRPVVTREMARFYPDLRDPVIDFVLAGAVADEESSKRDVLVGAVPRATALRLQGALAERGVTLEHLTILPRVVEHVFDATDASTRPSVFVALATTGPVIGCFHESDLRLYSEPPRIHARGDTMDGVVEHVERGALFLRQQFRSEGAERVVVVAAPEVTEALTGAIRDRMGVEVRVLDSPAGPDALLALGPAMDMAGPESLDLLPESARPRPAAARWARRLAVAAALVVGVAALLWSWRAVEAARLLDARVDALDAELNRVLVPMNRIRSVVESRRSHAERLAFLAAEERRRDRVQEVLRAVADAAPPALELHELVLERDEDQDAWRLSVVGTAAGAGSAAAVRAVDGLYRGIPARLPVEELSLDALDGALPAAERVAIDFEMSFIVRWDGDLER